jgi:hypothetical protein
MNLVSDNNENKKYNIEINKLKNNFHSNPYEIFQIIEMEKIDYNNTIMNIRPTNDGKR